MLGLCSGLLSKLMKIAADEGAGAVVLAREDVPVAAAETASDRRCRTGRSGTWPRSSGLHVRVVVDDEDALGVRDAAETTNRSARMSWFVGLK